MVMVKDATVIPWTPKDNENKFWEDEENETKSGS